MGSWQRIGTAPKDGTPVDLWARCSKHGDWERRPDCRWELMTDFFGTEFEGWSGLNRGKWWSCDFEQPTHWMLPPAPPDTGESDG